MTIETQSALESGAMESFTKLLSHKTATIRGKAARDVMDLRYIQSCNLQFIIKSLLVLKPSPRWQAAPVLLT